MRTNQLMLYKNMEHEELLANMTFLMENCESDYYNKEDMVSLLFTCMNELLEMTASHGFEGNLWHSFLTFLLVNHENAYSKACEIRGAVEGSINQIVLHDFTIIKEYFDFDFTVFEELSCECIQALTEYESMSGSGMLFNKRIRNRILELKTKLEAAATVECFKDAVTEFYKDYGVGKLGLHKAFRIKHQEDALAEIVPISNIAHVHLDDLVGYKIAKQKLIDNTEAFLNGKEANNCLLYGDAGTGKSTSIKAIANQYYDRGLRLIEIYKHQFCDLNDVITQIKNRNYKFIIYMDDLSFEEFEIEYKYLKAVIEGGLEKKPDNVLIYATSNRRHLIRENFSDKEEIRQDMHTSDTVQEKLSLYTRFGVSIYFGSPTKKEFQEIVRSLAARNNIQMEDETLLLEANKWELSHGGLSGRTAQQFINYLLGKQ